MAGFTMVVVKFRLDYQLIFSLKKERAFLLR